MVDTTSLTRRPLTDDDKLQVLRVLNLSEAQSPVPVSTTAEDLEDEWAEPGCDLDSDTWSLWHEDALVGWIKTAMREKASRAHVVWVTGRVEPAWERRGLGRELVQWATDRARVRLDECPPDLPKRIRAVVYDVEPASVALYESCGYEPERYFIELMKDLTVPAEPVTVPEGIDIVVWTTDRDEEVRRVHNDAFRDHWGSEPLSSERWRRWISANRAFLPEQSYVALAGDDVVGYVMNFAYPEEWEAQGFKEGWINGLGTLSSWRKRGVATALLGRSNDAFRSLGYTASSLGVDADSPTGAVGLYRNLGFEPVRREISYAIAVHGE